MLKVEFETATLVDAVGKAGRFAPTKGSALDKSGGIVLHFEVPGSSFCQVMATDLDNSFVRWVTLTDVFEHPDEPARWRVPHLLLIAVLNGLPIEAGGRTEMWSDNDQWVNIECGKVKARLALYDKSIPYPDGYSARFKETDEDFGDSENFAHKISQIAWATDPKSERLSGVHVTGAFAYATNNVSIARVPLDCPVAAPVTAAVDSGLALLKDYPEIALRATEDELQIMPDDETQVVCRLLKGAFPPLDKIFEGVPPESIVIERSRFLTAIARVTAPFTDKMPRMLVEIRDTTVTFTVKSPESGTISDEIEHDQHVPECDLWLTPLEFRNLLEGAGEERLELYYHAEKPCLKLIRVVDRQGYVGMTMPRTKP